MFTVAIIGRPNVGKSTLFNRLAGKKLALVDDRPGVTRDRREGDAKLGDLAFKIIDTAGLEEGDTASLPGRMRAQTETAVGLADAIFFVFDSRSGLTPADRFFANLVRRADKPLILIANKAEGRVGAAGALEGFDLGLGDPVPLSAEHGDGFAELYLALREALPEATELPLEPEENAARLRLAENEDGSELDVTKPLRIAIIGRPNAGNRLSSTRSSVRTGCSRDRSLASRAIRLASISLGATGKSKCSTRRVCASAPGSRTIWRSLPVPMVCALRNSPRWWCCCWTPLFLSRSRI